MQVFVTSWETTWPTEVVLRLQMPTVLPLSRPNTAPLDGLWSPPVGNKPMPLRRSSVVYLPPPRDQTKVPGSKRSTPCNGGVGVQCLTAELAVKLLPPVAPRLVHPVEASESSLLTDLCCVTYTFPHRQTPCTACFRTSGLPELCLPCAGCEGLQSREGPELAI